MHGCIDHVVLFPQCNNTMFDMPGLRMSRALGLVPSPKASQHNGPLLNVLLASFYSN